MTYTYINLSTLYIYPWGPTYDITHLISLYKYTTKNPYNSIIFIIF